MNIIVLDDSLTVRMIIESFLEDLGVEDDEVFSFENGIDALSFIKEKGADVVFSDINMPKMSGYDFALELFKVRPDLQKTFFAISGDENRESYMKMKENGVYRFLKKPIKIEHFNHFVEPEILKYKMLEKEI